MSDYLKGLVSVIMPTYRRSDMLTRAIDSVLMQSYTNIELLLVNDNEPHDEYTSNLEKIIQNYTNDPRFKYIVQEKHINGAAARNVGIRKARGEFIAFLDDDDWWKQDKIEKQVNALNSLDMDWGGVSCKIERYRNDKLVARLPKYKSGFVCKDILMLVADYATGTLLLRHEYLDQTGYFDENLIRHQDLQLLVNFTYRYKLYLVDDYLHCCDISDGLNRPQTDKIIGIKKAFFESINPVLSFFSKKEQRQIMIINNAEIGYVKLRNGSLIESIKCFGPVFTSFTAFRVEITKLYHKVSSKCRAFFCRRNNG